MHVRVCMYASECARARMCTLMYMCVHELCHVLALERVQQPIRQCCGCVYVRVGKCACE